MSSVLGRGNELATVQLSTVLMCTLVPLAQAKNRPSGLNAIARQNLLSSRGKLALIVYGLAVPAEPHTSTPTLERTKTIKKQQNYNSFTKLP